MAKVRAFQIYYDKESHSLLDPNFEPLDNTTAANPSWYEYGPIRKFLTNQKLHDETFYGFLSPRFSSKTHLNGKQVVDFVAQFCENVDVVTFSPHPESASCFVNVFEQADFFSTGLYEVCSKFFHLVDPRAQLESIINDSRNTIFCNYFFAKPRFWRAWFAILDLIFEHSSSLSSPLYESLNRKIQYQNDAGETRPVDAKIFVMERAASFLLCTNSTFLVKNFSPFQFPVVRPFQSRIEELIALDNLKIAYCRTGEKHLFESFKNTRDRLIESIWPSAPPRLFSIRSKARPWWRRFRSQFK